MALHEMPKEIRPPEKSKERAGWVREKAEVYRRERARDLAAFDALVSETKKGAQ